MRLKNQDWYHGELLHVDYREKLTIEGLTIEGFDCIVLGLFMSLTSIDITLVKKNLFAPLQLFNRDVRPRSYIYAFSRVKCSLGALSE